ncbi:hypothetical protein [Legionella brunensis]|nr:hypothetical protein [Legionella brunensis]
MKKELQNFKDSSPKVAITFYSKRTEKDPGYYTGILSEENRKDVLRLQEGLKKASIKKGGIPPQVEITLFLIPDWSKGEDYNSPSYLKAKQKMLDDAQQFYGKDIIIKDFLSSKVSKAELDFLRDCKSMGSVADIVKTRTIIDNAGHPCLQTDSNVTWANNDFERLYELTFAANKDALNASRCSEVYVSAHNKLVFTSSDSKLPAIFEKTLVDYCTKYNSDKWHKSESCNGVYDIAFGEGMCQYGLTYRVRVPDKYNPGQTFDFFPAKLGDERYTLMPLVVACQRESWRQGMAPPDPAVVELTGGLKLPSEDKNRPPIEVEINHVKYGYYHFKSLVRVFTNVPSWHSEEGMSKHSDQTKDYFEGAEHARNLFVSKQNTSLCMEIFARYYNAVQEAQGNGKLYNSHALEVLAKLIPDTEAGNKLCQSLFKCSAKELHANPNRPAILPDIKESAKMSFDVSVLPTFWQQKKTPTPVVSTSPKAETETEVEVGKNPTQTKI